MPGISVLLTNEHQLCVADLLKGIGKTKRIDLFLYTRGGQTESVWPFVSLLREHCDQLSVLVPFRAHSAGTMICLGANEVVMSDIAELSPIDPTTANQFNPPDPANPANRIPISVEDVVSYFKLSQELVGLRDEASRVEVFRQLTNNIHPLALGNVQRTYLLIRRLGQALLALHLDESKDKVKINSIIEGLTTEFFSHIHAIPRKEAISLLGSWVKKPPETLAGLMEVLFENYLTDLELRRKLSIPELMGNEQTKAITNTAAILETAEKSYVYQTKFEITQRAALPQGMPQVVQGMTGGLPPGARIYDYAIENFGWVENVDGF